MALSLLRSAVEQASDGILVLGRNGDILLSNPAAGELFARRQEELNGEQFGFPIADGTWTEIHILRGHGTPAIAEMRVNEARWKGERVFVAVLRDITERKQTERRLHRLQQLYAAVVQANRLILRTEDLFGLYTDVCKIAVDLGGMKMAWIGIPDGISKSIVPVARYGIGTDYLDKINISTCPDSPEAQGPTGIAAREGRQILTQDFEASTLNWPWRAHAKPYGWGSSATLPILRGGEPYGVLAVYHADKNAFDDEIVGLLAGLAADISRSLDSLDLRRERQAKRRLASAHEAKQKRSWEQYRTVIQASLDGFWVTDLMGRILDVNDAMCRMLGLSREELCNCRVSDIEVNNVPTEAAARALRLIKTGHLQFETRHKRKDGSIIDVEVKVMYIPELGSRFFAFVRDISERERFTLARTNFE